MIPNPVEAVPTSMVYTSNFTTLNTLHPSDHIIKPRACHTLTTSNNDLFTLLRYYKSPLIIAIDGCYHPPIETIVFPPPQPYTDTAGYVASSVVFIAIDNTTQDNTWINKPTILLLVRIQPLRAAYDTNPTSNNSAELLARIMALKLLLLHIPAIIIYDSQVVHNLHHNLTSKPYTAQHLA